MLLFNLKYKIDLPCEFFSKVNYWISVQTLNFQAGYENNMHYKIASIFV